MRLLCALLALASLALPATSLADQAPSRAAYVTSLVRYAKERRLASREEWRRLLHYRRGLFGGYTSEADADSFFLSPDGKTDPEAELAATVRAIFLTPSSFPSNEHAICKYPARFLWLSAVLHLEPRELPAVDCKGFVDFLKLTRPDSITLIFSSYYLNNPASAFGHTFLRINKAGRRGPEHNDLLDYGVDYGARVDTTNAVLYAMKGLLGLFPGDFRKVPYYFKVREYNDFESRDLWEYDLALSPEEVAMFTAHLWELGSTYFAYYYLSENCSYHVLGALEAASPRLHLLDHLGWPVIPADTVRALYRNPGLVRAVHYRPSAETVFRRRLRDLDDDERRLLGELVADPKAAFPKSFTQEQRVLVLDSALDLADSKYARELVKSELERDRDASAEKQELLVRRAEEGVPSDELSFAPPFRRMPHLGHESQRLGLGPGYSTSQGYYQSLKFRVALHDIADPAQGFPETTEIEFLPAELRYYERPSKLRLDEIQLIRIKSLSPWDRFRMPMSWTASLGATRIRDAGCKDCLAGQIDVGAGASVSLFDYGVLLYALADAQILGLSPIDGGIAKLPLRAGVGPAGGLRLRFSDDFLAVVQGSWSYLPAQKPYSTWSASAALRYQYVKNFALGVEGRVQPEARMAQAMSYIYF